MSFPSSPSNNQTAIVNGITHVYYSSKNAWVRQQTSISSAGLDDYARTTANTSTNNIIIIQGVDTTQNTRMSVIEGGLISANANTIFLNSLITTNNTRIDSANNTARAAYDKANAAFDKANTGSGSSSGYLANSVIIANTTGYLTNTSSIQFFTSNNNLVLTGNIIAGGVRNTTSSSAPANPTVGDIWYKTTNDKVYRYTYDGTGNYWIDINTPTVSTTTDSSNNAYADANTVIFINNNVISSNTNIGANKGAMTVGPVYYAAGVTVNMAANSRWVIL